MSVESIRVRVAAIIVRDDSILLVRHQRDDKTYWLLPGGGIEYGESAGDALVRELMEEASVTIRIKDLVYVNDSVPPDRHRHVLNLCFTAEIIDGEVRPQPEGRLVDVAFVPIAQLGELTFFPDIRDALLPALASGFPEGRATYLGNRWEDI